MKKSAIVAPPLRQGEARPLTSQKLRCTIGMQVVAIHCLVIFGPLGMVLYQNWRAPQENAFKVKLVGPLSTGEEVGPPMRLRPTANPGPAEPPAPEPPAPDPPKPAPPAPPAVTPPPPAVTRKPTPKPPAVKPKQTARKPAPKPPAVRPGQAANRNTAPTRKPVQKPRQLSAAEQVALARQQAAKRGDGGGTNTNIAVPIGNADRAQALGRQNNGTPGGGAQGEDQRYWDRLGNYIKARWIEPPGSLLGDARPQVTIQLAIAADGRVTSARITGRSGNSPMDESVQRMLANLDRVPAPSNGGTSIQMILRTQD